MAGNSSRNSLDTSERWESTSLVPTVAEGPAISWTAISQAYELGGHGGAPLSFYEAIIQPGTYTICCDGPWATTTFFTAP